MAVTIQHHAAGITAYETTGMQRAMHALREGERTWLIDPFHAAEFRDALSELPPLAGAIQLLDRHNRNCSEIAGSLDIPLHRVPRAVPGSGLEVIAVINQRVWREVALWAPQSQALVVAESVGTAPLFGLGRPAGMHPLTRLRPPKQAFAGRTPELLLVGHGPALESGATPALSEALDHARGDLPRLITKLPSVLRRS